MIPKLPEGFEVVTPGTGRVSDLSVAFRRVGASMFRLVVSLGKRTLNEIGIDREQDAHAVFAVNAEHTKMIMVLRQSPMHNSVVGNQKDGVLYFNVRLERLLAYKTKQVAQPTPFEVKTHTNDEDPAELPTHTFTFDLPLWVQGAVGPDNSARAAAERARQAAAAARARMQ